jgi:NAD(P)-dependent dehydrogenase (short-subunit alcohol dehydrogenase family)
VTGLTRTAAAELGPSFVRVNCVCPGSITTPISKAFFGPDFDPDSLRPTFAAGQPIPRAGEPADIAGTALWLASDDSTFVSGQIIAVDGGLVAEAFRPPGSGDGTTSVSFVTKD